MSHGFGFFFNRKLSINWYTIGVKGEKEKKKLETRRGKIVVKVILRTLFYASFLM